MILFKKGDIVYWKEEEPFKVKLLPEGIVKNLDKLENDVLTKDTPLEINHVSRTNQDYTVLRLNKVGQNILYATENLSTFFNADNFISEKEYKLKNNKPHFKAGDVVYYNKPDDSYSHHHAFRLWRTKVDNIFIIKSDADGSNIMVVSEYVDRNFISENDYEKKYGMKKVPDTSNTMIDISRASKHNYSKGELKTNFKLHDKVYYTGNKCLTLKRDIPYEIDYINPESGLMQIDKKYVYAEEFTSAEDYENERLKNEDAPIETKINKKKSEVDIKMQVYKDTKYNKLKWEKPYSAYKDWFRTKIKLDNPSGAYLRIDVKKFSNKWEMLIYYHRNENSNMTVSTFSETTILKTLVILIEKQFLDEKK